MDRETLLLRSWTIGYRWVEVALVINGVISNTSTHSIEHLKIATSSPYTVPLSDVYQDLKAREKLEDFQFKVYLIKEAQNRKDLYDLDLKGEGLAIPKENGQLLGRDGHCLRKGAHTYLTLLEPLGSFEEE